jgi:hypothetical protein
MYQSTRSRRDDDGSHRTGIPRSVDHARQGQRPPLGFSSAEGGPRSWYLLSRCALMPMLGREAGPTRYSLAEQAW